MSKHRTRSQKIAAARRRLSASPDTATLINETTSASTQNHEKSTLAGKPAKPSKSSTTSATISSLKSFFGYDPRLIFSDLKRTLTITAIILVVLFAILVYTK